jgi:hypothetical protein
LTLRIVRIDAILACPSARGLLPKMPKTEGPPSSLATDLAVRAGRSEEFPPKNANQTGVGRKMASFGALIGIVPNRPIAT